MKKFLLLVCLFLIPSFAFGQNSKPLSDKQYKTFVKKSPFNTMYPKVTATASARYFTEFNKLFAGKPIASKEARLVAVAASAAIRCEYCITAQVMLAKKAGASDDEIKAAIQIAAEVARFSILLYGNEFGQDKLKNILKKGAKPAKKTKAFKKIKTTPKIKRVRKKSQK